MIPVPTTLRANNIVPEAGGRIKLGVIIVNYKTAELVIQCLNSFLSQIAELSAEIIIVDNFSQDTSVATIRGWAAAHDHRKIVRVIETETNAGFSAGNNVGILAVNADYYLLLNSDTIVKPRAITLLLETAERFREAGIISPRLESLHGEPQESCFRYSSPISEFIDAAQTGPITKALRRFNVPLAATENVSRPQWTSFACALLTREMIDKVGYMDEGFFMYSEDVEYCRRARKAGWDVMHNPEARVVHLCGGSSTFNERSLARRRLPRYFYASRTRYLYLAYGWSGLTLANVLWSLGRCVSKCREALERRERGVAEKQWLDIWTNWLNPNVPWSSDSGKIR